MRGFRRRIVAVLAAYAIALQALLAAATAPAVALAPDEAAFTVCRPGSDEGGSPVHQGGHDWCLACLAGHCAAAGSDRVASIVPQPLPASVAVAMPRYVAPAPSALRSRPHGPRAPPAV